MAINYRSPYFGNHAGDAAALTYIKSLKCDSTNNGAGSAQNGQFYYQTTDNKYRAYINGAWADMDTTGGGSSSFDYIADPSGTPMADIATYVNASGPNLRIFLPAGTYNDASADMDTGKVDGCVFIGDDESTIIQEAFLLGDNSGTITSSVTFEHMKFDEDVGVNVGQIIIGDEITAPLYLNYIFSNDSKDASSRAGTNSIVRVNYDIDSIKWFNCKIGYDEELEETDSVTLANNNPSCVYITSGKKVGALSFRESMIFMSISNAGYLENLSIKNCFMMLMTPDGVANTFILSAASTTGKLELQNLTFRINQEGASSSTGLFQVNTTITTVIANNVNGKWKWGTNVNQQFLDVTGAITGSAHLSNIYIQEYSGNEVINLVMSSSVETEAYLENIRIKTSGDSTSVIEVSDGNGTKARVTMKDIDIICEGNTVATNGLVEVRCLDGHFENISIYRPDGFIHSGGETNPCLMSLRPTDNSVMTVKGCTFRIAGLGFRSLLGDNRHLLKIRCSDLSTPDQSAGIWITECLFMGNERGEIGDKAIYLQSYSVTTKPNFVHEYNNKYSIIGEATGDQWYPSWMKILTTDAELDEDVSYMYNTIEVDGGKLELMVNEGGTGSGAVAKTVLNLSSVDYLRLSDDKGTTPPWPTELISKKMDMAAFTSTSANSTDDVESDCTIPSDGEYSISATVVFEDSTETYVEVICIVISVVSGTIYHAANDILGRARVPGLGENNGENIVNLSINKAVLDQGTLIRFKIVNGASGIEEAWVNVSNLEAGA